MHSGVSSDNWMYVEQNPKMDWNRVERKSFDRKGWEC